MKPEQRMISFVCSSHRYHPLEPTTYVRFDLADFFNHHSPQHDLGRL